jgi:hypothetical protein
MTQISNHIEGECNFMGTDFDNGFGAGFVFGSMMSGGSGNSKKGGCYIATAVYGSYDCPEVWTLRRFRDYSLKQTVLGRLFIRCYYAVSPTLVKWFGGIDWLKRLVRCRLNRLVSNLKTKGVEDTPYNDPDN